MKAAFQGVHGAYSEVAARAMLGNAVRTIPCTRFRDVFEAVAAGKADRGVIPIENSLAGSIHENYDNLLTHRLSIVGEFHLRIEHVLMALPGTAEHDLRAIRSHPQALAQCSKYFQRHKGITAEAFFDTAGAAQSLLNTGDHTLGAIASKYAAELYDLAILRRNLENESHNYTRFLAIARKPQVPSRRVPTKCSIAITPGTNLPGSLFRILAVFSLRDIDLLKIESRPDPQSPFQYLFYVDLAGNPSDPNIARALLHLQELVREYRLLGAYPMGKGTFYGSAGVRP